MSNTKRVKVEPGVESLQAILDATASDYVKIGAFLFIRNKVLADFSWEDGCVVGQGRLQTSWGFGCAHICMAPPSTPYVAVSRDISHALSGWRCSTHSRCDFDDIERALEYSNNCTIKVIWPEDKEESDA